MPLVVQFDEESLCSTCSRAEEVIRRWGTGGSDVRISLSVLAECRDLETYKQLPNVSPEGDSTVFQGASVAVILNLRPTGPPPGVVISKVDVRDLCIAG